MTRQVAKSQTVAIRMLPTANKKSNLRDKRPDPYPRANTSPKVEVDLGEKERNETVADKFLAVSE